MGAAGMPNETMFYLVHGRFASLPRAVNLSQMWYP